MPNQYTERQALAHHGIGHNATTDDALTDSARAAGVVSVCLGCGTIVCEPTGTSEAARARFARAYDFSCCDDSDDILY